MIGEYRELFGTAVPFVVTPGGDVEPDVGHALIVAERVLQIEPDYRAALRRWFAALAIGGHLVVKVPHAYLYDRRLRLPSPWGRPHRRLYTPSILAREIEEALDPNSYRIRLLRDDDRGYRYDGPAQDEPEEGCDIVAVLEKLDPPTWGPVAEEAPLGEEKGTDLFFRPNTRIERAAHPDCANILLLKLDHLGDFVMSVAALERVRALFPRSRITLAVGSWNEAMSRQTGLVDEIVAFDVFPRNASEEAVDVVGKKALFAQCFPGSFDLAIDLRTDPDTRFLLNAVDSRVRAGLGTRSDFPFLDIFLPIDYNRNGPETSLDERLTHHDFGSAECCIRNDFRIGYEGKSRPKRGALLWGPYRVLRGGHYIFTPFMEIDTKRIRATLTAEVTLDGEVVFKQALAGPGASDFAFDVPAGGARFEFRIWADRWKAGPAFSFYGGRIVRKGSADVIHQSEYLLLLIDLVSTRFRHTGLLHEVSYAR